LISGLGGAPSGQWSNVIVSYDWEKIRGYLNGRLSAEKLATGNTYYAAPNRNPMIVGCSDGCDAYKGKMDEIRFYRGVFIPEEALYRYIVDLKTFRASIYFSFNGDPSKDDLAQEVIQGCSFSIDGDPSRDNVVQLSINASPSDVDDDGFLKSIRLNDSGFRFSGPDSNLATSTFSAFLWIKPEDMTPGVAYGVLRGPNGNGYNNGSWRIVIVDSVIYATLTTVNASRVTLFLGSVTNGSWSNAAVTYDGVQYCGYLNGKKTATSGVAGSIKYPYSSPVLVGLSDGCNVIKGHLDEIGIYGSALSGQDIEDLCNYHSSRMSSQVLQCNFNDNVYDLSGNENHADRAGLWLYRSDDGSGSIWFSHGYISFPSSPSSGLRSGMPLSISFWMKPDQISTRGTKGIIKGPWGEGLNSGWRIVLVDGFLSPNIISRTGRYGCSVSGITENKWNHIVMRYAPASGLSIFINGGLSYSDPVSHGNIAYNLVDRSLSNLVVGYSNGGDWYCGRIDDLRIYNSPISDSTISQWRNSGTGRQ
jgi:hypothetical protein